MKRKLTNQIGTVNRVIFTDSLTGTLDTNMSQISPRLRIRLYLWTTANKFWTSFSSHFCEEMSIFTSFLMKMRQHADLKRK